MGKILVKMHPCKNVSVTECQLRVLAHGYGLTKLRLYTSTKLKIVNYWFYSHMYKNKNLYLNNI
jgi:hypothetical protein